MNQSPKSLTDRGEGAGGYLYFGGQRVRDRARPDTRLRFGEIPFRIFPILRLKQEMESPEGEGVGQGFTMVVRTPLAGGAGAEGPIR